MQVNYAPIDSTEAAAPTAKTENASQGGRFSRKKLLLIGGAILTAAVMFISFQPAAKRNLFSVSSGLTSRLQAPFKEAPSYSVLYSAGMGMIHPMMVRRFGLSPQGAAVDTRSIFTQPHVAPQAPVRVGYAPYVPINHNVQVNPATPDKMAAVSAAHAAAEAAKKRAAVMAQLNTQARYPATLGHFIAPNTVQRVPLTPAQMQYIAYMKSKAQTAPVSEATAAKSIENPIFKESMKLAAIPKPAA